MHFLHCYSSALRLFPEAILFRRQRNTTKVQSRLYFLLWIFNYSVRTASYGLPFILPVQDQGRFQPLQLVQITCWNSSFLSSSISNLKITWVHSSSRYWRDWMLWWCLTHNKQSTMSETSGTDHCQREDTDLGMGVTEEVMLFKAQKEVAVENYCLFFFSLSVSDL